jgi:cobaltochelatase CobT|tara:strand:- start:106 stop:1080 length:975 start_codon:yes stop_codon:yes gene_type:complete
MVRTKLGGLPTDRFWAAPPAKQTSGYWRRGLIHVRPAAMPVPVYHPYTTKFDIEIDADHLDQVLGPLTTTNAKAVADAWDVVQTGLLAWRTKLHLTAADADARIRNQLSKDQLTGTVVTLLFDQSGSMRGQKMLFSAATADIIQEFLITLGVSCEVLGFTTSRWKGGRSRKRWKWRFRPRNPGRLNDLLHIIYRSATDNRASTGGWVYRQMLRHDLTKENIDGEAIQWAANRLIDHPANRKILIVLSDGAPVDDSTLLENGPTYLFDHLHDVVSHIISDSRICIASLGIGFRPHDFYPQSSYVESPKDMGNALVVLLESLLTRS